MENETCNLELGLIGDLITKDLASDSHPTPLKGVVGVYGLKPEHLSDATVRGAFEAIMAVDSTDTGVLRETALKKSGAQFCVKAIEASSLIPAYAEDRIRRLAERGRKRLAAEAMTRLFQMSDNCDENYFFGEMNRILREHVKETGEILAGQDRAADRGRPVTVEDFVKEPPPELDPIVAYGFEAGDKVELIAPSKCRKSFWALDLALHAACGYPFCGLAIPKKRRVLLVNLEIKRDWMKRRVLARLRGYGIGPEELGGRLVLMNCRGRGLNVREAILTRVQTLKPELVIIDPRYKLMRPDEDENTGNGLIGILNLLDAIAEEGAAVMIVSHDRKGDIKSQDIRDRGAGSNWAGRDVDCRFVLTPDKNDDSRMSVGILARNYPPRKPIDLRAENGKFSLV